jgi:hypothetical protein
MASPKPGVGALFSSAAPQDDLSADPHAAEHLMRWVGVAMFLLGSATLLATLPLPDPNTSDHPAIRIIAVLLALGAVIVAVLPPGRRWVSRVTILYGILLVSALMAVTRPLAARPSGSGPVLSTSAGVAALASGAPDPAALMLAADRALYAAKAAGRRRVAVWEGGTTQIAAHIPGGRGRDEPELAAHAL